MSERQFVIKDVSLPPEEFEIEYCLKCNTELSFWENDYCEFCGQDIYKSEGWYEE